MNLIKSLTIIIFLYFLAVLQTSFLVHFSISGMVINFVLILVIILNLCEDSKKYSGLAAAVIGGFFLDVFSSGFLGLNILVLLAFAAFIKLFLKKHVRIPLIEKI